MVEKEPQKSSSWTGNGTLAFAMTGCNTLSIKLTKSTGKQAIVSS